MRGFLFLPGAGFSHPLILFQCVHLLLKPFALFAHRIRIRLDDTMGEILDALLRLGYLPQSIRPIGKPRLFQRTVQTVDDGVRVFVHDHAVHLYMLFLMFHDRFIHASGFGIFPRDENGRVYMDFYRHGIHI